MIKNDNVDRERHHLLGVIIHPLKESGYCYKRHRFWERKRVHEKLFTKSYCTRFFAETIFLVFFLENPTFELHSEVLLPFLQSHHCFLISRKEPLYSPEMQYVQLTLSYHYEFSGHIIFISRYQKTNKKNFHQIYKK